MADVVKTTTVGLGIWTGKMRAAGTEPTYVGWGTGTTAPVEANTALETPAAEARTNGTTSQQTTTLTNDTYQNVATITCTSAGKTISEVGCFDAATTGNMSLRGTFTGLPLNVGDSITFTIKTKLANA